jgi:hypothetical protein
MSDKASWDRLIYGLIYPGFLGSMLYELIPTSGADFTSTHFLTLDNFIRYSIIFFYSLDYLHLYGDMDGLIKDPKKKSLGYFLVDVLTCLGYVAAFIALKIPRYWPCLLVFGLVPWLFRWYKRRNLHDKRFLFFYGCGTGLILIYRTAVCRMWPELIVMSDQSLALLLVVSNVMVYCFYVFWFYEHRSRQIDEILYTDKVVAARPSDESV